MNTANKPVFELLQGNRAVALGALYAGVNFYAGYPITPSSEIAEQMALRLPISGGKFVQMEDEIASMAAILGASLAGSKSLTATSGPGFSLMQENLGYGILAEIPTVIVNSQRFGPSTGIPTAPAQGDIMQARWGTHGPHPVVAFCPYSVKECFNLTVEAVNWSERLRQPVILLIDMIISHMRENVRLPAKGEIRVWERTRPTVPGTPPYAIVDDSLVPPMANMAPGFRQHFTGLIHDENGFPTTNAKMATACLGRLNQKINRCRDELVMVEEYACEDCEVAVVAYGSVARSALRAVRVAREQGLAAGLLRPITIWPFPDREINALAGKVKAIVIPEMNLGQLAYEVERAVAGQCQILPILQHSGELIGPRVILEGLKEVAAGA
ncbi:MAG: 2-oxoacid:acceptor oxidoreductase subunit alpha [Heliobacteriaceae bacterium]|nr:2-oxoacid:acceptor oxidoreductase subunit alpha [Heliobacteriaceae bacterium]MDD4587524.1 2-oxoacid:acceptor oxidoreductase subunit alpha [Heliobacteriaceae bacterium]